MKLRQLLNALSHFALQGDDSVEITGLSYDSRQTQAGDLFFCYQGFVHDGHDFAPEAVERGAAALLVEDPLDGLRVPQIVVDDTRWASGLISSRFFGDPTRNLRVIGVTGTNGKTTTSYLCRAVLKAGNRRVGLLGTIRNIIGGEQRPVQHTTPESTDLQRFFSEITGAGEDTVVMEVSSHALALDRVSGTEFDIGIFTNITQDHLDFHPSFQHYLDAKKRLFSGLGRSDTGAAKNTPKFAILNADDPYISEFERVCRVPVITFGMDHEADVTAKAIDLRPDGVRYEASTPKGNIDIDLNLTGRFNVSNSLSALSLGIAEDLELEVIKRGLESVSGVDGRFETIPHPGDFTVIVDYAHTPDGLQNILQTARELARNRVLLVFGCGGDRDRGKRPKMGRIAVELSDHCLVTSDNPRSEDPQAIIDDILEGIEAAGAGVNGRFEVVVDRGAAIDRAVNMAEDGDVVLIAGKGHEDYQIFADRTIHFDDREAAAQALDKRFST